MTELKSLQDLRSLAVIERLKEENPTTAFFGLEELQQKLANEQRWASFQDAEGLEKKSKTHRLFCPAADATLCVNEHKGKRIPNPNDSDDSEELEGSDREDDVNEGGLVQPCSLDNGYRLKERLTSEW